MDDIFEQNRIEREYFKNAQVGDLFYGISGHINARVSKVNVARVTKTQIVLENGVRINKVTGRVIGEATWVTSSYLPACPHITARVEMLGRNSRLSKP